VARVIALSWGPVQMVYRIEGCPELVHTRGTVPTTLQSGSVRALNAALRVAAPTGGSAREPVLNQGAHAATSKAFEE
jgi:hypothetical protein